MIPESPAARERAADARHHAIGTPGGFLLHTFADALAAHGIPDGVGLLMDHPDGVGIVTSGKTFADRWTAWVVLEAMGVTAITEDTHGFLRGVLPKGARLRAAPGPGTLGTPPPEPVKVCGCGGEFPATSRSKQCRQCNYKQWRRNHPPKRRRAQRI